MKNNKLKASVFRFKDIAIGKKFSFTRFISQKDVEDFARLTGDFNPLHLDESFASKTIFKGTIIHGMLAASLFSALIGMQCPGKHALILSQEFKYIHPIRPNSILKVLGEIINKIDSVKVLVIRTFIYGKDKKILIEGQTKVKVMR